MDKYTATELAFKNSYEKGCADAKAEEKHGRCIHCDGYGFCKKYSDAVTVWKCNGCREYEEYREEDDAEDD